MQKTDSAPRTYPPEKCSPSMLIFRAGLLVGTLDLTAAIIQTLIYGNNPVKMFQFIASGVFGKAALTGGAGYAVSGVLFHYCIAMLWTILFFYLYPKLRIASANRVVTGIVYGFFIWLVMSRLVLPLSATPAFPFKLKSALIAMGILMLAIGLPLSFIAYHYCRRSVK